MGVSYVRKEGTTFEGIFHLINVVILHYEGKVQIKRKKENVPVMFL